jgi:hypothetical protein
LGHDQVFDRDFVRAGHLMAQPTDQRGFRLFRIALSTYWHEPPCDVIRPGFPEPATRSWRADGSGRALHGSKIEISRVRVWELGQALAS